MNKEYYVVEALDGVHYIENGTIMDYKDLTPNINNMAEEMRNVLFNPNEKIAEEIDNIYKKYPKEYQHLHYILIETEGNKKRMGYDLGKEVTTGTLVLFQKYANIDKKEVKEYLKDLDQDKIDTMMNIFVRHKEIEKEKEKLY